MSKIFRAIRETTFRSLQKGEHEFDTVGVFFGFDRYRDNVAAVNEIAQAVTSIFPHIKQEDMTVWKVMRHESIRHAGIMTVMVTIPAEEVQRNLNEYTIL